MNGVALSTIIGVWLFLAPGLQSPPPAPPPIVGAWTLNADLSDRTPSMAGGDQSRPGDNGNGGYRRGGGGGGGRRGGMGGGGMRGGMGGNQPAANPEEAQRMRDAMRDILVAPPRLTIVQTDSQMILITTDQGKVTRLSPDGKKIKDESTKMDRRTKWDGGKLVSEISGAPAGKITETYEVDPERHQLIVTVAVDSKQRPITQHRVYDLATPQQLGGSLAPVLDPRGAC